MSRCEVAQYATTSLEPVAPSCGKPATWSFEASKAPGGPYVEEFHACDECARTVHLESGLEGERLAVAS